MSKRFIDTGIFDDDWFMDLSKDGKLLWIYFITKCDHAGIIKLNEKLCKIQTDIKDLPEAIKQLDNRLVTVSEHLYFIPKYIEFQYPGFPNSNVRQQQSAVVILEKYNLLKDGILTVSKELPNSYDNGSVIVPVIVKEEKVVFDFKKALIDIGVSELVAVDWMKVRKDKKASNTETAFKAIKKQIELTGASANDCIKKAVEKSWCGFEAEWYSKTIPSNVWTPSAQYKPITKDMK